MLGISSEDAGGQIVHVPQDLHVGESQPIPTPPTSLSGIRVFVAEDEPILLMALEDALGEFGCTVVGTAGRVKDSLAFLASNELDVAVLDGSLADGKIDPVVAVLVARGTPFVIASGFSPSHFSANFSGAIFLRKPYTDANLGDALLRALGPPRRTGV